MIEPVKYNAPTYPLGCWFWQFAKYKLGYNSSLFCLIFGCCEYFNNVLHKICQVDHGISLYFINFRQISDKLRSQVTVSGLNILWYLSFHSWVVWTACLTFMCFRL